MSENIYSVKKTHYIYILVDQNHKKYGGVRTCECSPENDNYMGSSSLVKEAMENGNVFTKHIIKTFDTRIEANEYEEKWLTQMNVGYNSDWYNQTNGAKNFCNYGKKMPPRTEEYRRKQSEAQKGKKRPPRTEEHRRKQSEAIKDKNKGQVPWNKGIYGYKLQSHTEETKKKISEAKKEWWRLKKKKK